MGSINNASAYLYDGIDGSHRCALAQGFPDSGHTGLFAGTAFIGITTSIISAPLYLWTAQFNGASSLIRRNGGGQVTGSIGTQGIAGFTIGNNASLAGALNGDWAEAIVCNALLSTPTIAQVETYLAPRYGITLG